MVGLRFVGASLALCECVTNCFSCAPPGGWAVTGVRAGMALGQEAPVSLSRVLKEETMLKKPLAIAAAAAALGMGVVSTQASAGDPVLGALLGGGIGAAIGHSAGGRDGGVVGGVPGALVGSSIPASDGHYHPGYYNRGHLHRRPFPP